jgi:large subunit ribosomal protein L35
MLGEPCRVSGRFYSQQSTGPHESSMPKQKTHKASKKRFRVSATGKLMRVQAGKKHLNSPKTGKRKRQLRRKVAETGRVAEKYVEHLGGK